MSWFPIIDPKQEAGCMVLVLAISSVFMSAVFGVSRVLT
jgi:hypothetical protein